MLDQGTDRAGEHLAVMSLALLAGFVAAQFLGPIDDGVDRDRDPLLVEAVPQGGIVEDPTVGCRW